MLGCFKGVIFLVSILWVLTFFCSNTILAAPEWVIQTESKVTSEIRQGEIYAISADRIVVDDLDYNLSSDVQFLGREGTPISLSDFRKGDFVSFMLNREGEILLLKKQDSLSTSPIK